MDAEGLELCVRAFNVACPEIRERGRRWRCGEGFFRCELPQAEIGAAAEVEDNGLAGSVFFGHMKLEHPLVPRA